MESPGRAGLHPRILQTVFKVNRYVDGKEVRRNSQTLLTEAFSNPGINPGEISLSKLIPGCT